MAVPSAFLPGRSILHRLDPRAKLILLVAVAACFFLPGPRWIAPAYTVFLALLVGLCLGFRELGMVLAAVVPVLAVICVLTPVFRRGGDTLVALFDVRLLTTDGLAEVLRLVSRFTGLTLAFYAVFRTLDMNEMVISLRWFGLPYRAALVLTIAFRFIPTLFGVYQNAREAHLLRMSEGRRRGFFGRTMPVLTSVVIHAVRQIPSLAMALEIRGFGRLSPRTSFRSLPSGRRLVAALALTAGLCALLIAPFVLAL